MQRETSLSKKKTDNKILAMFDCRWVSDVLNHNPAQKASLECRDFVINLTAIIYYYYLFFFFYVAVSLSPTPSLSLSADVCLCWQCKICVRR